MVVVTADFLRNHCGSPREFKEENSVLHSKLSQNVVRLLEHAVSAIVESQNDLESHGWRGPNLFIDGSGSILVAVRGFLHCRLLRLLTEQTIINDSLSRDIIQMTESFLKSLANLFKECSEGTRNIQFEMPAWDGEQNSDPSDDSKSRIVDLELDMEDGSNDMFALPVATKSVSGTPVSSFKWKFDIISMLTSFFCVLPVITWEVLFELMEKENDLKVCDIILFYLCDHFKSSLASLSDLWN